MKNIKVIIVLVALLVGLAACNTTSDNTENDKIKVAVSIVPQKAFVEAVGKDLVDVTVVIPPGASPANYQPTPKEMIALNESQIYFAIGVPTEVANIEPNVLQSSSLQVIHLHDLVADVYPDRFFEEEHDDHEDEHSNEDDHDHSGRDPHIWLSPKRVIVMVEAIKDHLIKLDPENEEAYTQNASEYIEALRKLDSEIAAMFSTDEEVEFIIMHPSLGYFADDYGLHMHSIEQDGKKATAEGIQNIIDIANEDNIKVIFYQAEFDSSQAKTIASEIGGRVLEIKPLSEDYIENMKMMANAFGEE